MVTYLKSTQVINIKDFFSFFWYLMFLFFPFLQVFPFSLSSHAFYRTLDLKVEWFTITTNVFVDIKLKGE